MNAAVLRLLLRPVAGSAPTLVIPAVAFAIVTTLVLTVVGGAQSFWRWDDEYGMVYQVLAAVALALLVLPLMSLGGAAARLSARRRDERLSTLRLLGVTPSGVAAATIVESTLLAATGALAGILGHLALAPIIGLIPFRGAALGWEAVLLPVPQIALVCAAAVLLAMVSAVFALRRVVISPLGVRMRATASSVRGVRAVIVIVLLLAVYGLAQLLPELAGVLSVAAVLAGLFGGTLLLLNVIGPWVLKVLASRQVRRAETPERLLAARIVLDAPKAAWRQVSGVSMASFMAVFAGTGVSLMSTMGASDLSAQETALVVDMRTGLVITLVASFLMVATSIGVTQASDILDQRDLHRSLNSLGVPLETVDAARRRAIMSPLLITSIGSALCAVVPIFPLVGMTMIIAPLSTLTIALVVTTGIALVWLSVRVTRPLLARSFARAA